MDCTEFMKLMSLYLDGALEDSLQAEGKVTLPAARSAARK